MSYSRLIPLYLYSAQPLSPNNLKDLEEAVKKSGLIKPTQTPVIKTAVDGDILGGIIVQIEDRIVDLSIASKVNSYAKSVLDQPIAF